MRHILTYLGLPQSDSVGALSVPHYKLSISLWLDRFRFAETWELRLSESAVNQTVMRVAGIDEVGRGALFGPVVAAAVVLDAAGDEQLRALGVTDSKKLKAAQRDRLAHQIRDLAQDWQIGIASVREIDRLNILQASLLAMRRSVLNLRHPPDLCQIDGNQLIPRLALPQETIVKGDQTVLAIAAASILAKVWRDQLITRMARRYPAYDLAANKGYGTPKHRKVIQQLGPTPFHRRSFAPCQPVTQQLEVVLETDLGPL